MQLYSYYSSQCLKLERFSNFLTKVVLACVAAVFFPFPNAREQEENCERVTK